MYETYVFVFLGVMYAVALAVGGWFVMHADRRRQWQVKMQATLSSVNAWFDLRRSASSNMRLLLASRLLRQAKALKTLIQQNRRSTLLTTLILATPVLVVPWLAFNATLEGYDDLPPTSDPVIIALLKGEQLVLPPALPPEVFITREIATERQEVASASREWMVLDADFRQRLLIVYQLMTRHGYHMTLLEGYRSPERQTLLAKLGTHVTNAHAYQSYHQYGLAADSAFYRNGKIVISEKDPWAMEGYRLYGQYAESVGLVWGGRWEMMDFGHVELRKPGVLARR